MRKTRLEQIRDAKVQSSKPVEVGGIDGLHELLLGGKPNPSQSELVRAEETKIALLGMVGSAKTSNISAFAWLLALLEGQRILIARRDFNDLKDNNIKRMEEMLARLPKGTLIGRDKSAPVKWFIQPVAGVEGIAEFTFMGLRERPAGYEFDSAFVDEADEVDESILNEVPARCRLKGKTRRIVYTFNPTDEDHHLYGKCTGLDAKGNKLLLPDGTPKGAEFRVIIPQPGENAHNLVEGYYEDHLKNMPPDLADRLVRGLWGSSIRGKPVYGSVFKRGWHVPENPIAYNPTQPLLRFHDFGFNNPFTFWAQPTEYGGLDVLWELAGKPEGEEIHQRIPRIESETRTRFPDAHSFIDWGDPAARQHKDTGSTLAVLLKNGILLHYNQSVGIDAGLRAVRMLLSRTAGAGRPAFRIDKRCSIGIRMLEKGYRYPEESEHGDKNKPKKDGVYDHPADALRYGIVGVFGALDMRGNIIAGGNALQQTPEEIRAANFSLTGIPDNASYDPAYDTPNGYGI